MTLILSRLLLIFIFATLSYGRERAAGQCAQGNKTALVQAGLSTSTTTPVVRSYPSCTVTVYLTGTLSLATIYSDNNSTPKGNPFTANTTGDWFWYADNGRYDVKLSGAGIPTPFTIGDVLLWDNSVFSSIIASGTQSSIDISALKASIFQLTLTADVSNFNLTGAFLGQIVTINICQDSSGIHSLTWSSEFQNPPPVIESASKCTTGSFFRTGSNTWKTIANSNTSAQPVNAKIDFGCKGDGTTDDSACFIAIRNYMYAFNTVFPITGHDGNGGRVRLYIPSGTYLVTTPMAFLTSAVTSPIIRGYIIEGDGEGTLIDYEPSTPGPLFYNNNQLLGLVMKDLRFYTADTTTTFFYSYSTSKAQDYTFYNISWYGKWLRGFELHGTNTNSDFRFFSGGVYIDNIPAYFFYAPDLPAPSADQFLFYDFTGMRIWMAHGNFLYMQQGGHINVRDCDFSGNQGSGDTNNPSTFFTLLNNSHSYGIAEFNCQGCRFEMISDSLRVLYSNWGSYGQVNFLECDLSSQALVYSANTRAFYLDYASASGDSFGGPIYSFVRTSILGKIYVHVDNNNFDHRRFITLRDCEFLSVEDWMTSFEFAGLSYPTEVNAGAWPYVHCDGCRGKPVSVVRDDAQWAPGTAYTLGQKVYSQTYTYQATAGGTSDANPLNQPKTRSAALVDGTVTWATIDRYASNDYAVDGNLKAPHTNMPANGADGLRRAFFANYNRSNLLPYLDAVTPTIQPTLMRVIFPPNSTVIKVVVYIQPGGNTQATNGSYVLRTDEYTPTTLATFTYAPLSVGGYNERYIFWQTGDGVSDLGTRSMVLMSVGIDQPAFGYAYIEYY